MNAQIRFGNCLNATVNRTPFYLCAADAITNTIIRFRMLRESHLFAPKQNYKTFVRS